MRIQTNSKINIHLKVCGKRQDAYHLIETLFLPLSKPADTISIKLISEKNKVTISSNSEKIPLNNENICVTAANAYSKATGLTPNWHIHIEKKIPIAAGLGGGSSNAAGVLNLLNSHYKKMTHGQLLQTATNIGADVPFFLNPTFAKAEGIGDKITPLQHKPPSIEILLINPRFPISSKWSYQNIILNNNRTEIEKALAAFCSGDFETFNKNFCNDLQLGAFKKFPILQILKSFTQKNGALITEMSGSGPTLFSIFENSENLKSTAAKLQKTFGKCIDLIPAIIAG